MEAALRILPKFELEEYERIFNEYFFLPYTWEHWTVADLIEGGCSDDGFDYFRAWLISMGEQPFREMVECADNLAHYADAPGVECTSFDDFLGISSRIYREKTGEEFPESCCPVERPKEPSGYRCDASNLAYIKSRFPEVWAKRCGIAWPDEKKPNNNNPDELL